ncbi:MAG: hypothetical protein DME24_09275 [Verrucomicrobia bacterium]|nr:MAG: hypothetical protein DME24_09275 [Verrucomicrobiota bacterium]
MSYAILQVDVAPTADQLKRAVKSLKTLTEADAVKMAVEARGILLKNLSLEDSAALQRALQSEGVPTEMIEANQLPKLPDAKFVRRMELRPEALLVYDPVGRAVPLPWQQIALLSAGAVRHFDLSQTRREETVRTYDPIRGFHAKTVTDVRHKVEDDVKLLLDIFVAGGAMRFQMEADTFPFKYCFDRPDLNLPQKLGLLIELFAQNAPQAIMNHGANALRQGAPGNAAYASKAALFDESTWLLWRMSRKEHGPSGLPASSARDNKPPALP